MTNVNNPQKPDSLLWSLGVPLLVCSLGVVAVLYFLEQKNQWNHSVERIRTDLRHIPPEWIGYRQTSVLVLPIEGQATCFALGGDSAFVVGSADPPRLSFFDETGTLLRTIDLPVEPKAIACGTPDTLFTDKIVVAHPNSIVVYTAEGEPVQPLWEHVGLHTISGSTWIRPFPLLGTGVLGSEGLVDIKSLVLTQDYLFAADSGNRLVYRFEDQVQWWNVSRIGVGTGFSEVDFDWLETSFDGFVVYAAPITMTYCSQNDLLYIANPGRHRVDVFTQDGVYRPDLSWGEPSGSLSGFAGCCNPIDLAVLDDGRILTVEKGISRVKVYRTDGGLDTVAAGSDILDRFPSALSERRPLEPGGRYCSAVPLSEGRIAVFDFDYATVRIFAEN